MTKSRKQFTFYASYIRTIRELPKSRRWATIEAIVDYALEGKEPDLSGLVSALAFHAIQPNIDSSRAKAEAKLKELQAAPEAEPSEAETLPKKQKKNKIDSEKERENKNKNKNKNKEEEKEKEKEKGEGAGLAEAERPAPAPAEPAPVPEPAAPARPEPGQLGALSLSERENGLNDSGTGQPEARALSEREGDWGKQRTGPRNLEKPRTGLTLDRVDQQEPFASMLRADPRLETAWRRYLRADPSGPPSEAQKLVLLSLLRAQPPRERAQYLEKRARGGL